MRQSSPMGAEAANPFPLARVQIEAVQTVTPWKPSGPRRPRRIAANPAALAESMQSRTCLVLLYKRPVADTTGWNLAGRLKESLNVALSEHPVIAGRLRQADDGALEVKHTDSGARLVQARANKSMEEFLRLEGAMRELAYWDDVEQKSIQYSPMLFVQLTIFEGQGYSIGLTCSLLATDPHHLSTFAKTWSKIHTSIGFSTPSIFHLSKFRRPSMSLQPHSPSHHHHHTTFLATSPNNPLPLQPPFTLFLNDPSGDLKIESRQEGSEIAKAGEVDWDQHVGLYEIGFEECLRPARAFCFLESSSATAMVVMMNDGSSGPETIVVASEVDVDM